jgi:hypothetical protein
MLVGAAAPAKGAGPPPSSGADHPGRLHSRGASGYQGLAMGTGYPAVVAVLSHLRASDVPAGWTVLVPEGVSVVVASQPHLRGLLRCASAPDVSGELQAVAGSVDFIRRAGDGKEASVNSVAMVFGSYSAVQSLAVSLGGQRFDRGQVPPSGVRGSDSLGPSCQPDELTA